MCKSLNDTENESKRMRVAFAVQAALLGWNDQKDSKLWFLNLLFEKVHCLNFLTSKLFLCYHQTHFLYNNISQGPFSIPMPLINYKAEEGYSSVWLAGGWEISPPLGRVIPTTACGNNIQDGDAIYTLALRRNNCLAHFCRLCRLQIVALVGLYDIHTVVTKSLRPLVLCCDIHFFCSKISRICIWHTAASYTSIEREFSIDLNELLLEPTSGYYWLLRQS